MTHNPDDPETRMTRNPDDPKPE
ncbi:hypothetical protein CCACVL1_16074 [Corchorus capsularis]|uniref:Uncharacterized protein n=1 Tax=Corchorus capsularis TaxID=210143 RepID=A0A1R3HZB6_COCAP|nr:hypothetical protein CCACVL1_16074 [Corchorus capsularis]